jgi:hypothetical protein
MQDKLIKQYKQRFNGEIGNNGKLIGDPVIIREHGDVKLDPKDEDTPHIQLVAVKPYFGDEERERRKTEFMRRTMLNVFYFEVPLVGEKLKEELERVKQEQEKNPLTFDNNEKKKKESLVDKGDKGAVFGMHEIGLKRTIFRTAQTFPSYVRRLQIIPKSKKILILTPAQMNALDLERRTEDLRNSIEPIYDDKVFLPLIQGAVATQVHNFISNYISLIFFFF